MDLRSHHPWNNEQGHSPFVWSMIGASGSGTAQGLLELVTEEMIGDKLTCGADVDQHVEAIQAYADAGFDELYVNQIGPDQDAFFTAYREHVLPRVR